MYSSDAAAAAANGTGTALVGSGSPSITGRADSHYGNASDGEQQRPQSAMSDDDTSIRTVIVSGLVCSWLCFLITVASLGTDSVQGRVFRSCSWLYHAVFQPQVYLFLKQHIRWSQCMLRGRKALKRAPTSNLLYTRYAISKFKALSISGSRRIRTAIFQQSRSIAKTRAPQCSWCHGEWWQWTRLWRYGVTTRVFQFWWAADIGKYWRGRGGLMIGCTVLKGTTYTTVLVEEGIAGQAL